MITNNPDFYNYLRDRGVECTYLMNPIKTDDLVIVFPETHNCTVCGNRFNNEKVEEYREECKNIIDWMKCSGHVVVVTPVIKFDSMYMYEHAREQYDRLRRVKYKKQIIHTKDIGSLLVPHRLQLRYVGIDPIEFDKVKTDNIKEHMFYYGDKRQQMFYLNVINLSRNTNTRRKLRYIPEYSLFSQLYKKLFTK